MIRAALYARVSKQEQAGPGHVSLEQQFAEAERLALERGYSVIRKFQDILTGLKPTRSGYQQLLEAVRSGQIDVVVAWKWDRWGRNAGESITAHRELIALGVAVESVIEGRSDPFIQGVYALVAEQSSRDTSQRTTSVQRALAARGGWMSGNPPVGYRGVRVNDLRTLEPDPEQAPLVRQLFERAATGRYSLRDLALWSEQAGIRKQQFRKPRPEASRARTTIARILRNPIYKGTLIYGRLSLSHFRAQGKTAPEDWIVVENAVPALVTPELWQTVQEQMAAHRRDQGSVRHSPYLLTSLLHCGRCGRRLYGNWANAIKGKARAVVRYVCSGRNGHTDCSLPPLHGPVLERAVKTLVKEHFTIAPAMFALAAAELEREATEQAANVAQRRWQLQQRRDDLERERRDFARRLLGKVIPEDVYLDLERENAAAIAVLDRELATLPDAPSLDKLHDRLAMLAGINWDDLADEEWRVILTALIGRIVITSVDDRKVEWQPAAEAIMRTLGKVANA